MAFVTALAASALLMLFPFLLRGIPPTRLHMALPIMLLGVAAAFVHGIGFVPDNTALRRLFGPVSACVLLAGGALVLFL
jgi:predicted membrane protein